MSRCPVCGSARVVVLVGPTRRGFCTRCGSRWVQDGSVQRAVRRIERPSASRSMDLSGPGGDDRSA